jgi:hypothetical protein
MLPNAEKLYRIAVSEPVSDQVVGRIHILVSCNIGNTDIIHIIAGCDRYILVQYTDFRHFPVPDNSMKKNFATSPAER